MWGHRGLGPPAHVTASGPRPSRGFHAGAALGLPRGRTDMACPSHIPRRSGLVTWCVCRLPYLPGSNGEGRREQKDFLQP